VGTLHDLIIDDVDDVFLQTDDFAEAVIRYPLGNPAAAEQITGIFIEDREPGSNEVDGDGVVPEGPRGERIRNSGKLYVKADTPVDDRDRYFINSVVWSVKRSVSTDEGMRELLLVSTQKIGTKKSRLKFN
jgi:hypothetical protein